jgi:hypothetical protein
MEGKNAFQSFLDRLSQSSDNEPRLMAISLELEAINSIFEASFRLHDRSRPVSWQGGGGRPFGTTHMHNIPTETGGNEDDVDSMNFESLSHAIESIPNGHTDRHVSDVPPTSAHSNISHFEELNEGIGPLDRLRYELVVPLYEEGDPEWADAFPRSPNKVLPTPPVVRILVSLFLGVFLRPSRC